MKHAREIKVGVLAAVCLFLLFFGINFLKGVNIFSPTNGYHGVYYNLHGLEEQEAVYIRGHKVGQVDAIHYDFTKDSAFLVDISIRKDIALPQGTQMALVSDGLLGGMAIDLLFPESTDRVADRVRSADPIVHGAYLPTTYVPGLMESIQGHLLAKVADAIDDIDSLVNQVNTQLEGNHIQSALVNVDRISGDLTVVSSDLKQMMRTQVPNIVHNADEAVENLNTVVADIKEADLKATVGRVDKAVDGVNGLIADVRDEKGTLGQLINNKDLYRHIDATVVSADSLLTDLKAHPKRYVHFSIFGKKDR